MQNLEVVHLKYILKFISLLFDSAVSTLQSMQIVKGEVDACYEFRVAACNKLCVAAAVCVSGQSIDL